MLKFTALAVALFVLAAPAPAEAWYTGLELEAARARARAGYYISPRDAELLQQYGCSNGTEDDFCRWLQYKQQRRMPPHKHRHRYHD